MATKEELKARAAELGLEVTRADGKPGEPTAADYEAVLEAVGAAVPKSTPAEGGPRTFTVHGPYRVFDKRRGEEITGEVRIHADTGDELLVVGAVWAVLPPLLASGWLKEKKGD